MTQKEYVQLLLKNLGSLEKSTRWLLRSIKLCDVIGIKEQYSEQEYDAFESLTSRFARVSDILTQKVLRSLDKVEFEDQAGSTMLDIFNRAEKRGIVGSVEELRLIRELRNRIAHEYAEEEFQNVFAQILVNAKKLIQVSEQIHQYCRRFV